jgi:hypothetical protein
MKKCLYISLILCTVFFTATSQNWIEPVQISTLEGVNNNPDFCIDNSGNIHCVWSYKVEDNFYKLYYSNSEDNGETWSEPEDILGNDSLWMTEPHLAIDSENNLYLSYDYNAGNPGAMQVLFRTYTGSNWSEPDTITTGMEGSDHNRMIIDNNDRIYVFWYRPESIYYRYFENNSWSEIQCPYNDDNLYFLEKAVVDSDNNLHCTGSFHYEGQSGYDDRIIYFKYTYEDNQWSEVTLLSDDTSWQGNDIDLDNDDLPHIAWRQTINDNIPPDNGSLYSSFDNLSWTNPIILAEDASEQAITVDLNNKTHIIDNEEFENGYRLVHYQFIDNEWVGEIIDVSNYGNYGNKLISKEHYLYMTSVLVQSISPDYNASVVLRKYEITTSIENNLIVVIDLYNIYPNPFTVGTTISYSLKETKHTSIKIYDLQGKLINTILEKKQAPGKYQIMWNGTDNNGKEVKCGLYLVRLQADRQFITRSVEIIK